MPYLAGLVILVMLACVIWWFARSRKPYRARGNDLVELRQAESKVKLSDPILRRDIDVLERFGSDLLQDAIELRRAQILRGGHPESPQTQ